MKTRIYKKITQRIFAVLLCLALCGTLLSCASTGDEPSDDVVASAEEDTITIWTFFDRNMPGYYYLFKWDELEEKYGVSIDVKNYSSDDMENKLLLALATGELPDAFYTEGGTFVREFIDAGVCAQTDGYISEMNYTEGIVTEYDDGKSYVIPCMPKQYALVYYDITVLGELGLDIPETDKDLEQLIKRVEEYNEEEGTSLSAISLGEKDAYQGNLLLDIIITGENSGIFDHLFSDDPDVNAKNFKKAMKKAQKLIDMGAFEENYLETGDSEAITNFIHHESAMLINSSDIMSHLIYNMGEDFSVGLFPGIEKEDGSYTLVDLNYGLSAGFCINSSSEHMGVLGRLLADYSLEVNEENVRSGYASIVSDCEAKSESFVESRMSFKRLVAGADELVLGGSAAVERSKKSSWRSLNKAFFAGTISFSAYLEACDELFVR